MLEENEAYLQFLSEFGEVKKPIMPNFNTSAYTDNEYLSAILDIQNSFEMLDEFVLTLEFLKGV